MAASCMTKKRTFVMFVILGCLVVMLKFLLFLDYVHAFHSDHQIRNLHHTDSKIVQNARNHESFAFSQEHKTSEISHNLPGTYVMANDSETRKGRYSLLDLHERVSPALEEIPLDRQISNQRLISEKNANQPSHMVATILKVTGARDPDVYQSPVLAWEENPVLTKGCPMNRTKVTSMVFVKVHKSASTTIANILARYALRYGLQVALPNKLPKMAKFNYFEDTIRREAVFPPLLKGGHYNVMFSHMIFNRTNIQPLMPSDTFYFAIMRHPEDRFMSSFSYYGIAKILMRKFGFSRPVEALGFFLRTYKFFPVSKPEFYNSLAIDTGLAVEKQKDPRRVYEHAKTLERDLHLILVVEHFDESVILLKRKACLRMKDILYMKKNVQEKIAGATMSKVDRLLLRKYQMADFILYDHFYKIFWEKVVAEGAEFFLEVQRFREVQKTFTDFCSTHANVSGLDFADVDASPWNERFRIKRRDCILVQASEIDMQLYLIERATKWLVRSRRAR